MNGKMPSFLLSDLKFFDLISSASCAENKGKSFNMINEYKKLFGIFYQLFFLIESSAKKYETGAKKI